GRSRDQSEEGQTNPVHETKSARLLHWFREPCAHEVRPRGARTSPPGPVFASFARPRFARSRFVGKPRDFRERVGDFAVAAAARHFALPAPFAVVAHPLFEYAG